MSPESQISTEHLSITAWLQCLDFLVCKMNPRQDWWGNSVLDELGKTLWVNYSSSALIRLGTMRAVKRGTVPLDCGLHNRQQGAGFTLLPATSVALIELCLQGQTGPSEDSTVGLTTDTIMGHKGPTEINPIKG